MKTRLFDILFSPAINWVGMAILFVIAIFAYRMYRRPASVQHRTRSYMSLAIVTVAFRLFFAGVKTILQYYAWLQSDISKFLLPPYQGIGVLLRYSWTHFWLNAFLSIGAALIFFFILRLLQTRNPRYFEPGETELGFLMALIAGWPQFVVFVPAVLLSIIIIGVIRRIFLHEQYTTFGPSFFLGTAIAFASSAYIIAVFDLVAVII